MARNLTCDICRKPTEAITGKIYFAPIIPGASSTNAYHSNYSHHCDVGVCCDEKILKLLAFRKRMSASQYAKRGRKDKK